MEAPQDATENSSQILPIGHTSWWRWPQSILAYVTLIKFSALNRWGVETIKWLTSQFFPL